jgi:NAD(P)H dehydrogenase (quinone)
MTDIDIVVVYHSGFGHTAAQARAVGEGCLRVGGAGAEMMFCEDAEEQLDRLTAADALIFGAPTYMGSASAPFKRFMDATSGLWLRQTWKDKVASGFTNSGGHSGDKLNTLVQLMLFSMQHGMVWVGLGLPDGNNSSATSVDNVNRLGAYAGAMAQSNVDQGLEGMVASDLETAKLLGERVALAAGRWRVAPAAEPADHPDPLLLQP